MAEIAPGNIHVIRNYNMNKLYEIISLKQFIIIIYLQEESNKTFWGMRGVFLKATHILGSVICEWLSIKTKTSQI